MDKEIVPVTEMLGLTERSTAAETLVAISSFLLIGKRSARVVIGGFLSIIRGEHRPEDCSGILKTCKAHNIPVDRLFIELTEQELESFISEVSIEMVLKTNQELTLAQYSKRPEKVAMALNQLLDDLGYRLEETTKGSRPSKRRYREGDAEFQHSHVTTELDRAFSRIADFLDNIDSQDVDHVLELLVQNHYSVNVYRGLWYLIVQDIELCASFTSFLLTNKPVDMDPEQFLAYTRKYRYYNEE